jgi:hypothetical protein
MKHKKAEERRRRRRRRRRREACTYNIISRRFRVTIVAVEKSIIITYYDLCL